MHDLFEVFAAHPGALRRKPGHREVAPNVPDVPPKVSIQEAIRLAPLKPDIVCRLAQARTGDVGAPEVEHPLFLGRKAGTVGGQPQQDSGVT